ncbi:hypothetical protein A0H81_01879 [Grifola frondosa]|uniref:Uncharacterized protein n=1 Tax=Grifola frondosa TaxID=5627 RepID=A0A1C7MKJ4_GRIFR|nr:hypothetical protein A0H81_01879 [Grifola frondosa]
MCIRDTEPSRTLNNANGRCLRQVDHQTNCDNRTSELTQRTNGAAHWRFSIPSRSSAEHDISQFMNLYVMPRVFSRRPANARSAQAMLEVPFIICSHSLRGSRDAYLLHRCELPTKFNTAASSTVFREVAGVMAIGRSSGICSALLCKPGVHNFPGSGLAQALTILARTTTRVLRAGRARIQWKPNRLNTYYPHRGGTSTSGGYSDDGNRRAIQANQSSDILDDDAKQGQEPTRVCMHRFNPRRSLCGAKNEVATARTGSARKERLNDMRTIHWKCRCQGVYWEGLFLST